MSSWLLIIARPAPPAPPTDPYIQWILQLIVTTTAYMNTGINSVKAYFGFPPAIPVFVPAKPTWEDTFCQVFIETATNTGAGISRMLGYILPLEAQKRLAEVKVLLTGKPAVSTPRLRLTPQLLAHKNIERHVLRAHVPRTTGMDLSGCTSVVHVDNAGVDCSQGHQEFEETSEPRPNPHRPCNHQCHSSPDQQLWLGSIITHPCIMRPIQRDSVQHASRPPKQRRGNHSVCPRFSLPSFWSDDDVPSPKTYGLGC